MKTLFACLMFLATPLYAQTITVDKDNLYVRRYHGDWVEIQDNSFVLESNVLPWFELLDRNNVIYQVSVHNMLGNLVEDTSIKYGDVVYKNFSDGWQKFEYNQSEVQVFAYYAMPEPSTVIMGLSFLALIPFVRR